MMEEKCGIEMDQEQGMTDEQYIGVLNLIIKMVEDDTPKEKLIEYLKELKIGK